MTIAGPKTLQKQLKAPAPRQNELQVMQPDAKSKLQDGGNWASHKAGEASRQQGSDFQSMLVRSLYGNPQMFNTLDLIEYADQLNDKFSETTKEEVRKAYAISLVGIYRELQRREDNAPRNYDNALMAQIDGRLVPWTQNNAEELQQIWPFALENLAKWFMVAGESNLSFAKAVIKPSEAATTRSLMGKQEQTMYEKASDPIGPLLRSEQQTFMLGLGQQLTAGDEDIKSGLNCLSSITVGDLRAVLNTALKGVRKKDDNSDRLKLIETAGVVYYVTDDRAYQIDRTGHIVPDNVFTLRASTLKPGAVYYRGIFGSSSVQKERVLTPQFRVDAQPRLEEGDIYFRYLNTEYLRHVLPTAISTATPKQNDEGYFIASAGGVAIITAPKEDRLPIEFSRNFDWRSDRTFERVFHHLYWASQLAVMLEIEDKKRILSGQITTDDLINLVHKIANKHPMLKTISAFLNGIQEVEWGAKIYKAIKRAKGNDELDLAAQMIALRIASDALGHAKGKVLNKAKVVAKKVREERSVASTANVKEGAQPAPRTAEGSYAGRPLTAKTPGPAANEAVPAPPQPTVTVPPGAHPALARAANMGSNPNFLGELSAGGTSSLTNEKYWLRPVTDAPPKSNWVAELTEQVAMAKQPVSDAPPMVSRFGAANVFVQESTGMLDPAVADWWLKKNSPPPNQPPPALQLTKPQVPTAGVASSKPGTQLASKGNPVITEPLPLGAVEVYPITNTGYDPNLLTGLKPPMGPSIIDKKLLSKYKKLKLPKYLKRQLNKSGDSVILEYMRSDKATKATLSKKLRAIDEYEQALKMDTHIKDRKEMNLYLGEEAPLNHPSVEELLNKDKSMHEIIDEFEKSNKRVYRGEALNIGKEGVPQEFQDISAKLGADGFERVIHENQFKKSPLLKEIFPTLERPDLVAVCPGRRVILVGDFAPNLRSQVPERYGIGERPHFDKTIEYANRLLERIRAPDLKEKFKGWTVEAADYTRDTWGNMKPKEIGRVE